MTHCKFIFTITKLIKNIFSKLYNISKIILITLIIIEKYRNNIWTSFGHGMFTTSVKYMERS